MTGEDRSLPICPAGPGLAQSSNFFRSEVSSRRVTGSVSEDILGGQEPLFFGDVEDRLLGVGVAGDEDVVTVTGLHRILDPLAGRIDRRLFQSDAVDRRLAAGETEQLVALDDLFGAVLVFEIESDAAIVGRFELFFVDPGGHRDIELLAVQFECGVAEGWLGLVDRPEIVLDDGQVHPACLREIRHEFHPDVAKAHDDPRLGELGRVEDVGAGHVIDLPDSGCLRDVHARSGRDDDVLRFVLLAAGLDPPLVDKPGCLSDEGDVLPLGQLLDTLAAVARPTQRVFVLALDHPFEVDIRNLADEPVVVACLVSVRARR